MDRVEQALHRIREQQDRLIELFRGKKKVKLHKFVEEVAHSYRNASTAEQCHEEPNIDKFFESKKNKPHFHDLLVCLDTEEEMDIVCKRVLSDMRFTEIAELLGKPRQVIQHIYNKAIDKMRVKLDGNFRLKDTDSTLDSKSD